jgi:hypothetical protein
MSISITLAQVSIESIMRSSSGAQQAIVAIWEYLGSSMLYSLILNLSRLLLGAAMIFYAYQMYRRILDDLDYKPLIPLIFVPLIFILLLGNPNNPGSSPIWTLSVQLRNTIYWFDRMIMTGLVKDADLAQEIRILQVDNYTRAEAEKEAQLCLSLADAAEREKCLKESFTSALGTILVERAKALGDRQTASSNWFDKVLKALEQTAQGVAQTFSNPLGSLARGLGDIIIDALGVVIVVMSNIFNFCIEAGFIIVAIIAPFAVCFSLFPLPTKPIYAWLIGYMGVGLWKVGTNLLAGVGAYIMNRTDDFSGFNYIMFSLLVGVFAPVIAGAFSGFSALSISQGFGQGTAQVIQTSLKTIGLVTGAGAFLATGGMLRGK